MNELVESILEVGMLQPIVVRPLGGARFELVMGERRWRAAQQARVSTQSRPSCAKRRIMSCFATPFWRTSIAPS